VGKASYYVVWKGRKKGVFASWSECEKQVKGFVGAEYKGFETLEEARAAIGGSYGQYRGRSSSLGRWRTAKRQPRAPSVSVDAACSGSPGQLEYRGVETGTSRQLFREGPFADGTNNVGEFLAIVEAFRWLDEHRLDWPVYSDSENAIGWVRARKCNTKLKRTKANRRLFEMLAVAEAELRGTAPAAIEPRRKASRELLKWETAVWGENPADFGRK
jgi:ribonuclease HI